MRTSRSFAPGARSGRIPIGFLGLMALSIQLSACSVLGNFHAEAASTEDKCVKVSAGRLSVSLPGASVSATSMSAQTKAGCSNIRKVEISGWVDSNDNGTQDPGEDTESTTRNSTDSQGSSTLDMGNVTLGTNGNTSGDAHLSVNVTSVDGSVSVLNLTVKDCD